jgi:DNA adenine methylase
MVNASRRPRKIKTMNENQSKLVPPLKWVGGKRKLMPEIIKHVRRMPTRIVVPFFGGGASAAAFAERWPRVPLFASDIIEPLIRLNKDLSDPRVISAIESYSIEYANLSKEARKTWYYALRGLYQSASLEPWADSALLFVLLRACYSGMYRQNKKNGRFDTPAGFLVTNRLCDMQGLEIWAKAVQKWNLATLDYRETVNQVIKGSLVYLDPPYAETYDGYTCDSFDQSQIVPHIIACMKAGADQVIMSQSAVADRMWIDGLKAYDLEIHKLQRREGINRNVAKKGRPVVQESLIVVGAMS